MDKIYYIDSNDRFALSDFRHSLTRTAKKKSGKTVILCIGTDRATGDSLGPLIGYKLERLPLSENIIIKGTLKEPVHAGNLEETMKSFSPDDFIIAVDACLGEINHINYISVGRGSIQPGAGVNKQLPSVGDMFITGIVNMSYCFNMSVLQHTRLYGVMQMADIISKGLWLHFHR